jgi:hypothetical protein
MLCRIQTHAHHFSISTAHVCLTPFTNESDYGV